MSDPGILAHAPAELVRLIPAPQLLAFKAEPAGAQAQVFRRLGIVQEILAAGRRQRTAAIRRIAERSGVSPATIRRHLDRYTKGGWAALIDRRRFPSGGAAGLPPTFEDFVRKLFERHQRDDCGRQVHRAIIRRWAEWRRTADPKLAIPGYSAPPEPAPGSEFPEGWSYPNINRLRPPSAARALRSRGPKSLSELLPFNYQTRAGLRFGQRVFFDDQVYDIQTNLAGRNSRAMRPLGFNSLDQLSGAFVDWVAKLTVFDEEERRKRQLNQRDFTHFVIHHLIHFGYRDDSAGSTLIFEYATASGWRGFDEALHQVTAGRVSVHRGGRFTDPAFSNMLFRPKASGNFRSKAPLESIFKLVRSEMAALPGPTGRNFDLAPEELHGMDAYNRQLLKAAASLPPERAALLQFPYLKLGELVALLTDLYRAINARTDHQLEGWSACGFTEPRFRLAPQLPWQPRADLARLPADTRHHAAKLAEWREFQLSPAEVVAAHRHELTRLSPIKAAALLPLDWAEPVKVRENCELRLRDPEAGGEPAHFIARLTGPNGRQFNLRPGEQVLAIYHPINGDHAWLYDPAGRFLGLAHRFHRANAADEEAILQNQHKIAAAASDLTADARRRGAEIATARQAMASHNRRVISGDPVTPAEIHAARSAAATRAATTRAISTIDSYDPAEALDALRDPDDDYEDSSPSSPVDPADILSHDPDLDDTDL